MDRIKKHLSDSIARIKESAKNNPVLFGTAMISISAIVLSIILIGAGVLRDIGYLLIAMVTVMILLPDSIKDFLLGLIYGKKTSQEEYPVFIGWNGTRFVPESIQESFKRLSDCFESWYYTKVAVTEDLIQYQFKVYGVTDSDSAESLVQAIAEKALRHQFSIFMQYYPDYSALTHVHFIDQNLTITFARSEQGVERILQAKEYARLQLHQEAHPDVVASIITENWEDSSAETLGKISYGYDLQKYEDYGVKSPVLLPLKSHPHILIVGSSGSGKSKALVYLLGKLIQACPDIIIWLCDFKNSEDFSFLTDYPRYYSGNNCYQGITDYYKTFTEARSSGKADHRHLLIFDEYPGCILYYQGQDKREKTKKASDILSAVSEILMLGRGTGKGFGLWTVCQRADSSWFPSGARQNYMISLCLGRISKEQKSMLFPGEAENIPDRIYKPGEGVLLADGQDLQIVKFPLVEDTESWEHHIKAVLTPN